MENKRIWGWYFFDWAAQPFYTLGLTFIFGPYFAAIAAQHYLGTGMEAEAAEASAQSLWSWGQMLAGFGIAITAPFLGAWADTSGRKIPWIAFFSVIYVAASAALWGMTPDGAALFSILFIFYIGFFAAESALNFTNAILPSLGSEKEVGRISGNGAAFGYWGGVLALFIMLLLLAENEQGVTLLGNPPPFGLDPEAREGTRSVGPFIAIWYVIFMVPFFLWVRDGAARGAAQSMGQIFRDLRASLGRVAQNKSLLNFLIGSMFYRDALNAIYAFGGVYAALVLDWSVIQIGTFGIISAIAAAIVTALAGRADARFGPKPVIRVAIWALILVALVIVGMSREAFFGLPLPEASPIPDIVFYLCGCIIGGAGGSLYAASRSLMVRHTDLNRPTEAFGLFALSGKATAFLAPAGIGIATTLTGSTRLGFIPVILLFIIGLYLLRHVRPEGNQP